MNRIHISEEIGMGRAKLEVGHLEILTAIADEGGVTRAGQRLNLTQSALSHRLRDAEEKLGTRLFLRTKRRLFPTPAGEQLLKSARRILDDLKKAENQVESFNGDCRGTVRITTECYTCYHWFSPLLTRFYRKYPDVEVVIHLNATRNPVAALLEGEVDLAILSSHPSDKQIALHPLFADEFVVVMAVNHRLARKPFIGPRDFERETLLIYPPRNESFVLNRLLIPSGVRPNKVLEVPLTEAMIEMASAGIAAYRNGSPMVTRPLTKKGFGRVWSAATLKSNRLPAYLNDLTRLLEKAFPSRITA
jgi:LysR family transcriptional regulator for metE and metH